MKSGPIKKNYWMLLLLNFGAMHPQSTGNWTRSNGERDTMRQVWLIMQVCRLRRVHFVAAFRCLLKILYFQTFIFFCLQPIVTAAVLWWKQALRSAEYLPVAIEQEACAPTPETSVTRCASISAHWSTWIISKSVLNVSFRFVGASEMNGNTSAAMICIFTLVVLSSILAGESSSS